MLTASKTVVKRPFRPVDIEIRGVTRFSYGQTQDGEIVVWALGEAGWFELHPHRSYANIFSEMLQAVETLYFVTDIYNEPRKRGGGPSPSLVFQEYAEDERFPCSEADEAASIFHKHKDFLITCFLNKAQGIGWSTTPLYQYFRRSFPKAWEMARARIEGRHVTKEKELSNAVSLTEKIKGGRSNRTAEEKMGDAPKKDDNWWEAAAIFEFMQKAVNQGAMRVGHVTLDRLAQLIVKRYEIDEVDTAKNVLLVHANNLCYIMDHPRRKSIRFFASEPIYSELVAGHNMSATEVRRAQSVELRPRQDHGTLKDDVVSDSNSITSIETPQQRPKRGKKGRVSILRPKGSKFSGKGMSVMPGKGKGKGPVKSETEDEDDEDDEDDAIMKEDNSGDVLVDTSPQSIPPGKRKHVPDNGGMNPWKRAASASPLSSPIPTPDLELELEPQSPPSSSEEEGSMTPTESLPLRWRSGHVSTAALPSLPPPVISSPLPTYTANGPGESWICTFDGCTQKVYGTGTELGRRLIKEHLQDHARGRQKEVGLVMSEELKLRLPVKYVVFADALGFVVEPKANVANSNLIKRIREMSEAQQTLFPSLETSISQPMPIERRE
jgi:hypothetical protein